MDFFLTLEPWWRIAAALLIGALIGLEREFVQQRSGEPDFAGIRTFSLIALLGAVGAYLSTSVGPWVFLAAYLGVTLLVWSSYHSHVSRGEEEGITTEVAALLTPLLAAMVVWGELALAAALGVVSALLLALKPRMHELARRMDAQDLRAVLEFGLVSAVILPILPNQGYGPYAVLNPFRVWLFVVLVSGISLLGYVLMKVLGTERGIGLSGLLGGLVSSTATSVGFAGRSKESPALSRILSLGIILSSSVMYPRILVEVAAVHPPLLSLVWLPMAMMLMACLVVVWAMRRRSPGIGPTTEAGPHLANPLRLTTAITFGVLFSVVVVIVRAAEETFGDVGVYVASGISGVTDVDALTLGLANLAALGQVELGVAATSIILGALVNTLAKGVLVWSIGSRELRGSIARGLGIVFLVGGASGAGLLLAAG